MRDQNIIKNYKKEINLNTKAYNTNKKYVPSVEDNILENEACEFEYDYDEEQELFEYDDTIEDIDDYLYKEVNTDADIDELQFFKEFCLNKFIVNRGSKYDCRTYLQIFRDFKGDLRDIFIVLAYVYDYKGCEDAIIANAYKKLKNKYNLFKLTKCFDFEYKLNFAVTKVTSSNVDLKEYFGVTEIINNKVTDNSSFVLTTDVSKSDFNYVFSANVNVVFPFTNISTRDKTLMWSIENSPKLKEQIELFI